MIISCKYKMNKIPSPDLMPQTCFSRRSVSFSSLKTAAHQSCNVNTISIAYIRIHVRTLTNMHNSLIIALCHVGHELFILLENVKWHYLHNEVNILLTYTVYKCK